MTEAEMIEALRRHYSETADNGSAWAFIPKVRNAAGFDANGTCDAICMDLWPSRGLLLHGFEIKVTRSDWLRELKNPDKSQRFIDTLDRWWVVAADSEIVREEELPEGWGLLVADKYGFGRLVQKVEARPLRPDPDVSTHWSRREHADRPVTRSFLAALLRAATRSGKDTDE